MRKSLTSCSDTVAVNVVIVWDLFYEDGFYISFVLRYVKITHYTLWEYNRFKFNVHVNISYIPICHIYQQSRERSNMTWGPPPSHTFFPFSFYSSHTFAHFSQTPLLPLRRDMIFERSIKKLNQCITTTFEIYTFQPNLQAYKILPPPYLKNVSDLKKSGSTDKSILFKFMKLILHLFESP